MKINTPIVEIINGVIFCSQDCPFLKITSLCNGICTLDNKQLYYYDWYLAHCTIDKIVVYSY